MRAKTSVNTRRSSIGSGLGASRCATAEKFRLTSTPSTMPTQISPTWLALLRMSEPNDRDMEER